MSPPHKIRFTEHRLTVNEHRSSVTWTHEWSVINPDLLLFSQSGILYGSSMHRTPRWASWSMPSTAWPTASTTCRKRCVPVWWVCATPCGPSMGQSSSSSSWRPTSPEWPGKTFTLTRTETRLGGTRLIQ